MFELSPAEIHILKSLLPTALITALRESSPPPAAIEEACAQLETSVLELAPFVPSPVVNLRLPSLNAERIVGVYRSGTIVFAELSGVAALTSQLSTAHRRGSEEMSDLLNRLFGSLIEEIYRRGGGLVKFGGDSLTAFFNSARLGANHTALASAAALAMQARMAEFASLATSMGAFQLGLHVAIHSGKVFAAEVGDDSHTELIVTGRAINRVVVARESAGPGEVIITNETLQGMAGAETRTSINGQSLLLGLRSEPPQPEPLPGLQAGPPTPTRLTELLRLIGALRPYVPYDLPRRFVQAASGGEFRPVTVLFANFYAFSRILTLLELPALIEQDPEIVGRVLNTYYTRTQEVIHNYGGSVNKVDMATFGDRLMALFGAPTAHEDDPKRAVRAAIALRTGLITVNQEITALLREWVQQHPEQHALLRVVGVALRQRIGIASGIVFAGIVGTPLRHEYTIIGGTTHMAARLLASAENGDILMTGTIHRATRDVLEAESMPPVRPEGFVQAVPIFRAVRAAPVERVIAMPHYAAPLIGRQSELAQILSSAQRALGPSASGQVVAICGEAGVGKSRLADEAMRAIQTSIPALNLVRDSCLGYEQTLPYALMARIMRQALNLTSNPDRDEQAAIVLEQVEQLVPNWSRFAPLLGPLLNLPLPESELTRAITPEQRHDRLHDLVVMLCFALARRRPLVLIFDDIQWADASSLSLAQRLAEELNDHPLLLVLIYRPVRELAEPWRDTQHCTMVPVGTLARTESEVLLTALLGGALPEELRPLIERMHGTPLFLEETVRYLRATGTLKRNNSGAWVCTRPITEDSIPLRIEQLIMARLDQLPEDARALLQIGAVLGPRFSEELLAQVSQGSDSLARLLELLVDTGLLEQEEQDPSPSFRFSHILIRDVTYSSMLYAHRRELHEHIANTLEHLSVDEGDEQRLILAQHYLHAELWDQAFPHFLAAASAAQARYANNESRAIYEQALDVAPWRRHPDLPPDLQSAIALYENLGDVLTLTSVYDSARNTYQQLLDMLDASSDDQNLPVRAALLRKMGNTYEQQGDLDQAIEWLERAGETVKLAAPNATATIEQARVLSDNGWIYYLRGELVVAQQLLEQALMLISPYDVPDEQGRMLNRLGGVAWRRGNLALAQQCVEQSLATSQRSGDLVGQAKSLNNLSILSQQQGKIEDAIRYSQQAIEISEQVGNLRMQAISTINIGSFMYYQLKYEEAHTHLRQALDIANKVRDSYHQRHASLWLGRVLAKMEQFGEAEHFIQRSQLLATQQHLQAEQMDTHVTLAELALQQNDTDRAVLEYQEALPLAVEQEREEYGRFLRLEAQLAFIQGNAEHAMMLLRTAEALYIRLQHIPELDLTKQMFRQMMATDN